MTREEILMAGCQEVLRTCQMWRKADNMAGRICSILEGAIERSHDAASESPKVAVFIEGGLCVGVHSDQKTECMVIDRDTEAVEDADGEPSQFDDGTSCENLPHCVW